MRIRPGTWLVALAGLFLGAAAVLAYTGAQAGAGQQVFASICASCHGTTLGGGMGPALTGATFQASWRTAAALFQFVSQQMPLSAPGSLAQEQYWNVVAYLLQQNGVQADEQPLGKQTARAVRLKA